MLSGLRRFIRRAYRRDVGTRTYAQSGEDIIVDQALRKLQIEEVRYLDIGAHHPIRISNTYRLYRSGQSGVCVEPDPVLFEVLRKVRSRDVCLNVGVAPTGQDSASFYVMSARTLSTFSFAEAKRIEEQGEHTIDRVIDVPLISIAELLDRHFASPPSFVSIDTEGSDLDVLQAWDFDRHRAKIFCIETLTYDSDNLGQKIMAIPEFMSRSGYVLYADTHINSIFVDEESLKKTAS